MKVFKSHPLADKVPIVSCDTVWRLAAGNLSQFILKFTKKQVSSLLGFVTAVKQSNITSSDMGPILFHQSRFTMKQQKFLLFNTQDGV